MAWDIAIDLVTGDLVWTGINDFASRDGSALDKQRIHARLFIERGEFIYDPTNGALGSRLLDILRLPRQRALNEADLYVREALEPMDDIEVVNVNVEEVVAPVVLPQTPKLLHTNWIRNPSAERSIDGWTAYQNGITGILSRTTEVPAFSGGACFKLQATNSAVGDLGMVTTLQKGIAVAPGEIWTVTGRGRSSEIGVPRYMAMITAFWDAATTFLGSITGAAKLDAPDKWTKAEDFTLTVPTNAVKMTVYLSFSSLAINEIHYGDALMAVKGSAAPAYFDGDSDNADWKDIAHDSPSLLYAPLEKTVTHNAIRLSISYRPRFDNSDIATPPETSLESFAIDVPA